MLESLEWRQGQYCVEVSRTGELPNDHGLMKHRIGNVLVYMILLIDQSSEIKTNPCMTTQMKTNT